MPVLVTILKNVLQGVMWQGKFSCLKHQSASPLFPIFHKSVPWIVYLL